MIRIVVYASPIWSPYQVGDKDRLETVQHKFLRYLSYKNGSPIDPFCRVYNGIMSTFKVPSLDSLRSVHDATFAFKLINNFIDSAELSNHFQHRIILYDFRYARIFDEETYGSNYTYFSTIPRLIIT